MPNNIKRPSTIVKITDKNIRRNKHNTKNHFLHNKTPPCNTWFNIQNNIKYYLSHYTITDNTKKSSRIERRQQNLHKSQNKVQEEPVLQLYKPESNSNQHSFNQYSSTQNGKNHFGIFKYLPLL